jgi:hypothetical protein
VAVFKVEMMASMETMAAMALAAVKTVAAIVAEIEVGAAEKLVAMAANKEAAAVVIEKVDAALTTAVTVANGGDSGSCVCRQQAAINKKQQPKLWKVEFFLEGSPSLDSC